jgi:hypothetical protein
MMCLHCAAVMLQVDDDDKSDLDDDELEAINATAAAATNEGEATTAGGATTKEGDKQKSVRMSVTGMPGGAAAGACMCMLRCSCDASFLMHMGAWLLLFCMYSLQSMPLLACLSVLHASPRACLRSVCLRGPHAL